MYNVDLASGHVIASDTQASVAALDGAVAAHARLCASIIEVSASSKLPIVSAQKMLQSITAGMAQLVAGRADLVETVHELTKTQSKTSLREVGFGCSGSLGSDNKFNEKINIDKIENLLEKNAT